MKVAEMEAIQDTRERTITANMKAIQDMDERMMTDEAQANQKKRDKIMKEVLEKRKKMTAAEKKAVWDRQEEIHKFVKAADKRVAINAGWVQAPTSSWTDRAAPPLDPKSPSSSRTRTSIHDGNFRGIIPDP